MAGAIDTSLVNDLGLARQEKVGKGNNDLGEDAFLRLVLAQLENQDPLNPMENGEFIAQLAQLKSVTGIDDLNKSVDQLVGSMQSNQALQASSLVGRWVMVPGDTSTLWQDAGLAGAVDVPERSAKVLVTIKNEAGEVVRQLDMGEQSKGVVEFVWDGEDSHGNTMPAGNYNIEASASMGGKYEAINTLVINPVESVSLNKGRGDFTLNVTGEGSVKMKDVQKVM